MNGRETPHEEPPKAPITERKKDPIPEKNTDPEDASNSKEMCAYCETPMTVSSKFYNITNIGHLEYIGRRLNHLGPKKNPFCDRVCKRHYDLNLKRDKAQRQYNAKRERLPGIDVILGMTKKQRLVSSGPHPHPQSLTPTDFNPSPLQPSRIGNWYPTLTPIHPVVGSLQETRSGMLTPTQSLGQPVVTVPSVSTVPQTTQGASPNNPDPIHGYSFVNPQRGMQWVWETPNIPGTTTGPGELNTLPTPTDPIIATKPDPIAPGSNPIDPQKHLSTFDLVALHMINILSLFSIDSMEYTNMFESIKQSVVQQEDIPSAINAICSHAYNIISKIRQAEMNEKQTAILLRSSIHDLMEMLLKREHREEVLLKGDDEIDALFIEWVNLQKSTKAQ